MLNNRELAELENKLAQQKEELIELLNGSQQACEAVGLDQTRQGRLSRMDALQAQAMFQASRQRWQEALQRIGAAQARMAAGEYGYCLRCDEAMDPRRLALDPAATLCVDCAEATEQHV